MHSLNMMDPPRLILKWTRCWVGPMQHAGCLGPGHPTPWGLLHLHEDQVPSHTCCAISLALAGAINPNTRVMGLWAPLIDGALSTRWGQRVHGLPPPTSSLLQCLFPFMVSLCLSPSLPYRLSCLPHWLFLSFSFMLSPHGSQTKHPYWRTHFPEISRTVILIEYSPKHIPKQGP